MSDEETFTLNLLGADTTTANGGGVPWLKTSYGNAQPIRPAEIRRVRTVAGRLLLTRRVPGLGPGTKSARTIRRRRRTVRLRRTKALGFGRVEQPLQSRARRACELRAPTCDVPLFTEPAMRLVRYALGVGAVSW
jgi:hypothetical protein